MSVIHNYRCPECGSSETFEITADAPVAYILDGEGEVVDSDICGDADFTLLDDMTCNSCGHSAQLRHFRVKTVGGLPMVLEK